MALSEQTRVPSFWRSVLTSGLTKRAFLLGLPGLHGVLQAQSLPEVVSRCRRSVVAVGTFSALRSPRFTFSGSGFAVGDGTVVATCAHVLADPAITSDKVELSVQVLSDRGDFQWRSAKVLVRDRSKDLCLLKIEGSPLQSLGLSENDSVDAAEGTSVALMGFPIGGALGFSVVTHRGIVSSLVSSTAPAPTAGALSDKAVLSARAGAFELLQLDATAYPGNSGGPLLNVDNGRVIGVVSMVLVKSTRESALSSPTGITYAVPARYLSAMLRQL